MRHALTIAGSDSGGGAGIQADLKTFAAFGIYGTSAITAVTAQNTLGVTTVAALSADLVTAQIEAIAGDIRIDATKIGMLATAAIVEAVASAIEELDLPLVVLDPVMVSSSGEHLLDEDGIQALRVELLPRARVVTPNIPEAEVLSGCRIASSGHSGDSGNPGDWRRAAERIHEMGAAAVVITGGPHNRADVTNRPNGNHVPGDPDDPGHVDNVVVDLLFDGASFTELKTPRVATGDHGLHGTGCTFASALAAGLALGEPLAVAAARAQRYVAGAIAHSVVIGRGARVLDHFWQTRSG
jgi:hydroxymethylpyrimidine/phosphomethylpyrimidine kinase